MTGPFAMLAPLSILVLLGPALVLSHLPYDTTDYANHPMIEAAMEAQMTQDCSAVDPDPNMYWMKKFLTLVKDRLPQQAVTWEDLQPNLRRLVEFDEKGYLKAVAKGELSSDSLEFPNEHLRPLLIPSFMPCRYPPETLPTIVLEQIYNDEPIFRELIAPSRKRRSISDDDAGEEEEIGGQSRAFHYDRGHYSNDIPAIDGHFMDHEVDEVEMGDDGEVHSRKRRSLPDGMAIFPQKNTLFAVKTLCVLADGNGQIVLPDE